MKKSAPSKSGVTLSVATIWDRKYYRSGEKLPFTIQSLPEHLRPYVVGDEPEAPDEDAAPQATYILGEVYNVDGADHLVRRRRRAVERQMVEMSAQAAEEDALHEEFDAPLDETLASAVQQAQSDHAADVALQLAQLQIDARRADAAQEAGQQWVEEQHEQEIADSDAAALVSPSLVQSEPEAMPADPKPRKKRKQS